MYCAIGVEPTKPIALISGSSRMASTASLSPLTTWSTPGGNPASIIKAASIIGTPGPRPERAALRIGVGPLDLGGFGVFDGGANLGLRRQRDLGLDVAGHRLENVGRPPGGALDLFAADEMSD